MKELAVLVMPLYFTIQFGKPVSEPLRRVPAHAQALRLCTWERKLGIPDVEMAISMALVTPLPIYLVEFRIRCPSA